jgi:hypothetical protein
VEVVANGAEVEAVDEDAVFGGAAEEAAVEACLVHLEEEGVVLAFGQRHQEASGFLAEEEGVEAYLARSKDIETYCLIV